MIDGRRRHRLKLFKLLICLVLLRLFLADGLQPACAQSTENFEVLRVYIPDDPSLHSDLIPDNFPPINNDELLEKLRAEEQRRLNAEFQQPVLSEAIYLARLQGRVLESQSSRWRVSGRKTEVSVALGSTSLALQDVLDKPTQQRLLSNCRFNAEGLIQVPHQLEEQDFWFGFRKAIDTDSGTLEFSVPPANLARLLIVAPANITLDSDSVPVRKIESPKGVLPDDWPTDSLSFDQSVTSQVQWWSINLAGVSNCMLKIDTQDESSASLRKHVVGSADYQFTVKPNSVDVAADYSLVNPASTEEIRLRVSTDTRVKAISLDGKNCNWKVIPSLSKNHLLIELPESSARQIRVSATRRVNRISSQPTGYLQTQLPDLAIAQSLVLSGNTTIACDEPLMLISVENSSASSTTVSNAGIIADPGDSIGSTRWKSRWIGQPPSLEVRTDRRQARWRVDGLTKITVQPGSLSAVSTLRIESPKTSAGLNSNELRLPIGGNWLLDDVRFVGNAPSDLQISRFETAIEDITRDASGRYVIVSWSELRDELAFELEARAHQPLTTEQESSTLDTSVLLALPGALHDLHYALDINGSLQLIPSTELLAAQEDENDLPAWQRAAIEDEEPLLFSGTGETANSAEMPRISVASIQGTFTATMTAIARSDATDYRIRCEPTSGSIREIPLVLPLAAGAPKESLPNFTLLDEITQIPTPLPIDRFRRLSETEVEITLQLPEDLSRAFELRASQISIDDTDSRTISLWAIPAASNAQSMLIVPRQLAAISGEPVLDLLPARSCCSNEELAQLQLDFAERDLASLLAARVDASVATQLKLYPTLENSRGGWIWQERVIHRLGSTTDTHEIQWLIERTNFDEIAVFVPKGWAVKSIQVAELDVPLDEIDSSKKLLIPLPESQRVEVVVTFVSASQRRWLAKHHFDKPRVELQVHKQFELVELPSNRVRLANFVTQEPNALLVSRLVPSKWWTWFSPAPSQNKPPPLAIDRVHGQDLSVWTVERTAASTVLIAALLCCASLCYWLCRSLYIWIGSFGILSSLLIVAPLNWTPYVQLLLLALVLSAMVHLVRHLAILPTLQRREDSMANSARTNRSSMPVARIVWFAFLLTQSSALAQVDTKPPKSDNPVLYGVLTPVDEQGQVSGNTVYIPQALDDLLTSPNGSSDIATQPGILSADYVLRTRQSGIGDQSTSVELQADFRIIVGQANTGMELPFLEEQLELQSMSVQGQERLLSAQSQTATSISFDAPSIGIVNLQLVFKPTAISQKESGALELVAKVPRIPNATLRILSEESSEFQVISNGGIQRFVNSEILTSIGPVDELVVSWVEPDGNSINERKTSLLVDSWVHAAGDELLAICQMQIDPATLIAASTIERESGRRAIRVTTSGDWDVVGTSWGGAFHDNPASYLFGGRRVYTLELSDPQVIRSRALDLTSAQPVTLRVVMVPNLSEDRSAVGIPFLKIGQQPTRRLVGWSTDGSSPWRFDDLEFEQEVAASIVDWGGLQLGSVQWAVGRSNVKLFQVRTLGAGALQIRKSNMPSVSMNDLVSIQEQTKLHVGVHESRYEYSGVFDPPSAPLGSNRNEDLQLELPGEVTVDKILINGETTEYVQLRGEISNRFIIFSGKSSGEKILSLEFSHPTRTGEQLPLIKPTLNGFAVSSSEYQVFAASGVECEITGPQVPLAAQFEENSAAKQLETREQQVAAFELVQEQRDRSRLATQVTVSLSQAFKPSEAYITLEQQGEEWYASFILRYANDETQSEFAYIDLPYAVRDIISLGSTPRVYFPAPNPDRVILCVQPKRQEKDEDGISELRFTFRLDSAGSSQALRVPAIRILSEQPVLPLIAAPKTVAGRAVQWSGNIRQTDELPLSVRAPSQEDYLLVAPNTQGTQLTYQFVERSQLSARVTRKSLWLSQWSENGAQAVATFWLEPRGQLTQEFQLPVDATITGVLVEGTPAIWQGLGNAMRVTLQPNYMPVEVQLLVKLGPTLERPQIIAKDQPKYTTLFLGQQQGQILKIQQEPKSNEQLGSIPSDVEQWFEVVIGTLRPDSRIAKEELAIWASNWSPTAKGISETTPIDDRLLVNIPWIEAPNQVDLDQDGQVQAIELWRDLVTESGLDGLVEPVSPSSGLKTGNSLRRIVSDGSLLAVQPLSNSTQLDSRLIAASLLALASILALVLTFRLRRAIHETLARHLWGYWAILALAMWIFLPLAWPAYFMAVVATGLMIASTRNASGS